jgi:hypothetical protein
MAKTHLIFTLLGALLGVAVASLVVPPALTWYASPGGLPEDAKVQVIVEVPQIMHYATSKLILGQSIGAGIGAASGLGFSIFLAVKRRKGKALA